MNFNCFNLKNLIMEDITDANYMHAKKVGEYHDFYLKSDTLLLVVDFENYRKMSLKIYELYPAKLSSPKLA